MTVGKPSHHLARPLPQRGLILADAQTLLDGASGIQRMTEHRIGLGHRDVRGGDRTILSRPRVEGREQDSVNFKEVRVGQRPALRQVPQRVVQPRPEQRVLEFSDDLGVFLPVTVAQVACLVVVLKRIEHPASAISSD